MTIDRASVEEGARLAAEATPGPWTYDEVIDPDDGEWRWIEPSLTVDPESSALSKSNAAFIAHWNPEFAAELAREWLRLEAELVDARRTLRTELEELTRLRRVEEALKNLLEYAERVHGGDRTLTSEEYYIVRDYARAALADPAVEDDG